MSDLASKANLLVSNTLSRRGQGVTYASGVGNREGRERGKEDNMVEKNPWWKNVSGPFPSWEGPIGCKEDGGGSHRGQGLVGKMNVHRAVNNQDKAGKL